MGVVAKITCDAEGCERHFYATEEDLSPFGIEDDRLKVDDGAKLPEGWRNGGMWSGYRVLCRDHAADCPDCDGVGYPNARCCERCDGSGLVAREASSG